MLGVSKCLTRTGPPWLFQFIEPCLERATVLLISLPPLLHLAQLDHSCLISIDQPVHFFLQDRPLTLDAFPFALLARDDGRITS